MKDKLLSLSPQSSVLITSLLRPRALQHLDDLVLAVLACEGEGGAPAALEVEHERAVHEHDETAGLPAGAVGDPVERGPRERLQVHTLRLREPDALGVPMP